NPHADRSELLWAAQLYEQIDAGNRLEPILSRACTDVNSDDKEGPSLALLLALERLYGLRLRAGQRQALLPLLRRKLELLGGQAPLSESQPELVMSKPRALRRIELLATALQLGGLLAEQGDASADLEAATLYDAVAGFAARHKEAAAPLGRCLALAESARLCER